MLKKCVGMLAVAGLLVSGSSFLANAQSEDLQKQIDKIMGGLPKFAVPMREVGDRFQNMYFAAEGGNWGLAAYMSKYMFKAMNPAMVTKPKEYPDWKSFYETDFAAVNKAIAAHDIGAFQKAYEGAIQSCNACHEGMGYGFIEVTKLAEPADKGINYTLQSKASDVPD